MADEVGTLEDVLDEGQGSVIREGFEYWIQVAAKYPLLNPEEEISLIRLAQAGDTKAHDKMVNCNLRLVISIAKRFSGSFMSQCDLIQEGNIGLIRAIGKFDTRRNTKFGTYATWWIRSEIGRALEDNDRIIGLPCGKQEATRRIEKEVDNLTQLLGRKPTFEDLEDAFGPERADEICQSLSLIKDAISLETPVVQFDETSVALFDVIPDEDSDQTEDVIESIDRKRALYRALCALEKVDAIVLSLRFGLLDGVPKSYNEIAELRGVNRSRIEQQEKKALRILRQYSPKLIPLRRYAEISHKEEIPKPEGRIMVV